MTGVKILFSDLTVPSWANPVSATLMSELPNLLSMQFQVGQAASATTVMGFQIDDVGFATCPTGTISH